jgi:general secretion pathway protein A
VEWLRNQLAQINGKAAEPAEDPVFDEAMLRQVKQFQLAQGLPPTGIVGTQTLMRLSGAADVTAPKLVREQRGK